VSRMIDLIKQSAVPATVMRSAARGALSLPSAEMVEILVHLSDHQLFGEQAKLSLAGFNPQAMKDLASDPATPPPILQYMASPRNVRPALLPLLAENPAVPNSSLLELAQSKSAQIATTLLNSPRVQNNRAVLDAMLANHELDETIHANVTAALAKLTVQPTSEPSSSGEDVLAIEEDVSRYLTEHATEIAAEEAKGFELTDLTEDEKLELQKTVAAPIAPKTEKKDTSRMSPLQRIAQMAVGERVQLAMKGSREDRYILIRDGSKVVSSAVLESPKLTDQEVEMFAAMKNVQQSVLRGIAGKRKFMKLYPVLRALTANPRCPIDVALPILKSLLVVDLRGLSLNKNVSDTLRKVATKMYKEKGANKKSE
jgi:hypothetical protein